MHSLVRSALIYTSVPGDDESDEGFIVPHGYLSEDEGAAPEDDDVRAGFMPV